MTKIYTDPSFDILGFVDNVYFGREKCGNNANGTQYYTTSHISFYLCLLPKNIKEEILEKFTLETKSTFESILNIDQVFCRSIEDSDYVLLPPTSIFDTRTKYLMEWRPLIEEAKKYGKKLIIMLGGDNDLPFPMPEELAIIFRRSGFLSESGDNVMGLPTLNFDFYRRKHLPKQLSIGFCGHISHPKRELLIETFMKHFPEECDFILRPGWGGIGTWDDKRDYIKNLNNNLYCLCSRGEGNYSYRLGETLMMGRIPILLDTDCILPFRESIPYETNCIFITENDIPHVKEIVMDFHERHSEDDLIRIQKENRSLWEKYFVPDKMFQQIIRML